MKRQYGPIPLCRCGCGNQIRSNNIQCRYLPECQRRRKRQQEKARHGLRRSRIPHSSARLVTDPPHRKGKPCPVCASLSERRVRVGLCKGCGLPYAEERRVRV